MHIRSILHKGFDGIIIDVECHVTNNLPNIVIVGFANKAVNEARERIRGAFASSRIMLPRKRVIINLAPADIPKADSSFDMAMALAIMQANGQLQQDITADTAFIGELGLNGSLKPIRGIIGKLLYGRNHGLRTFFIPAANLCQAQLVPDITLIAVENLAELFCHFTGLGELTAINTRDTMHVMSHNVERGVGLQFSDVVGQLQSKRALEIAAAGGHNVLMSGPPGTGKSMLAKAMPSILPALSQEEMLEVTHLHSLASHNYEQIIRERPFRSPHHSASQLSIIGGGATLRPGEISLSHRGVLFFDELPEFSHDALEALRQPLEDRTIRVARQKDCADFPASFILVATANPCPCGYYGSTTGQACSCSGAKLTAYQKRLSGPILDRIDLYTTVDTVDHRTLLTASHDDSQDAARRHRVHAARVIQAKRYRSTSTINADMSNQDIAEYAHLDTAATSLLNTAASNFGLSARAYMRAIKVARTIADIEQSTNITEDHVAEAIRYRSRE